MTKGFGWVRHQDLLVLLLSLGVVLGIWGFFALADEVREGDTRRLDEAVILALRQPGEPSEPLGPPWLPGTVRDITALGSGAVLALFIVAVAGFVALRRQYRALLLLLAAVGGGVLLMVGLKDWFERPRPEFALRLVQAESWSFPSGHSLVSTVVYLTLGTMLARTVEPLRLKIYVISVGLFLAFLVGLSRIYLGVHYPTDVLAGWTIGLVWAVLCWLAARWLQRRGRVEGPT